LRTERQVEPFAFGPQERTAAVAVLVQPIGIDKPRRQIIRRSPDRFEKGIVVRNDPPLRRRGK
jgi:hypothetical protein